MPVRSGALYAPTSTPINERICHCRLCQKAIGAAFNARVLFRIDDVTIEGPLATVNTSPDLKRGFCPSCGTTMFSRRDSAGIIGITTGLARRSLGLQAADAYFHRLETALGACSTMACRNMKAARRQARSFLLLEEKDVRDHDQNLIQITTR